MSILNTALTHNLFSREGQWYLVIAYLFDGKFHSGIEYNLETDDIEKAYLLSEQIYQEEVSIMEDRHKAIQLEMKKAIQAQTKGEPPSLRLTLPSVRRTTPIVPYSKRDASNE